MMIMSKSLSMSAMALLQSQPLSHSVSMKSQASKIPPRTSSTPKAAEKAPKVSVIEPSDQGKNPTLIHQSRYSLIEMNPHALKSMKGVSFTCPSNWTASTSSPG